MNVIIEMEEYQLITKRKLPWFAEQSWIHTLFLHWPITKEALRPLVPEELIIDTYNGSAWISIVTFHAEDSKLRHSPKWTSLDPVTQINVRTYVTVPQSKESGVYFFSIHLKHLTAALGAKTLFQLPFHYAQTKMKEVTKETIHVTAQDAGKKLFSATYTPDMTTLSVSDVGSFLAERYCIWNVKGDRLIKIPIKHQQWDLYDAKIEMEHNNILPFQIGTVAPEAFYSPFQKAIIYPYETYDPLKK